MSLDGSMGEPVVYLVGAGPGDVGLLTMRGAELLAKADVVVFDQLVDLEMLRLCRPDVVLHDVGKRPGGGVAQEEINELLIDLASEFETIVRLKGGDPFVFGRGGEEIEALRTRSIRFEVVPGVSASTAVPAYAGIPVTHRGVSKGYLVITGHEGGGVTSSHEWQAIARSGLTVVVLMGAARRREIAEYLIAGGMAPSTPVTVVMCGTTSRQKTIRTRLDALGDSEVVAPATMVIGECAALSFEWFDDRPLRGLRVVLTRGESENDRLGNRLRELGAEIVAAPTYRIVPEPSSMSFPAAAGGLSLYEWAVFTSANAVRCFLDRLEDLRELASTKLAVIGSGTARALGEYRLRPDLVVSDSVGEGLVAAFPSGSGEVLFPRARIVRGVVADGLRAKGWQVRELVVYDNVPVTPHPLMRRTFSDANLIVFTSGSAVTRYLELYGDHGIPPYAASIGPVTSEAMRAAGIDVTVEATQHDFDGLVDAIIRWQAGTGFGLASET
ncbi:MAG: uroporphyrinogen-III C-methyltransferase [Acidimicrobiales bacterium]